MSSTGSTVPRWGDFRSQFDVSVLVPEEYAHYRPVIRDAVLYFVERLPPERLERIIAQQLALPLGASMITRLMALMHHCPTLHKLGQVVARHNELDQDLRDRLQGLETMAPATPLQTILPLIERQLPNLPASGVKLAVNALAEASVAVVVPFAWQDADAVGPSEGVLKVLKPGIEDRLGEELELWPEVGGFLDDRCTHYHIPELDYRDSFDDMRTLLTNEVHLDQEQRHLAEAARFYHDTREVRVPALLPFCTPRITAMEWIHGHQVTQPNGMTPLERRNLAEAILRTLVARPLWSAEDSSLFHADPHAGNLFVTEDRRVAILDWSLVGHLTKQERVRLVQALLGALTLDSARITSAIAELSTNGVQEDKLKDAVSEALRRIRGGMMPGLRWLVKLLDAAYMKAGVRFSADLMMFRKAVLTLEGVVGDVSASCSMDSVLHAAAVEQFSREWTQRLFAFPLSRHFASHVSNVDLLEFLWALPGANFRFLVDTWLDCLEQLAQMPYGKSRN